MADSAPEIIESWSPHKSVQVEAHTISETNLVSMQIVLDRKPDHSWTTLFIDALSRRRHHRVATFLGRYICLQPAADRAEEELAVVEGAINEANGRYEREIAVIRYRAPRMTAAA